MEYFIESEELKTAFTKFREKIAPEVLATETIEGSKLESQSIEIGGEKCTLKLLKV